jgi:hypothetical protein
VLTFFSIPKRFEGEIGEIQRRAIASWEAIPDAEVLLYGDGDVATNDAGTPLVSDAFARAQREARHDLLAYVNADIVVGDDFGRAAARVERTASRFLMIGECWSSDTRRKRGADHIDYFVFTRGLYDDVPPFAVGRMGWDNWLVWKARDAGALVVDATKVVRPIHQDHDYAHTGGLAALRSSDEFRRNIDLVGGKQRTYSRFDATHVLTERGLRRNIGAAFHAKERARRAVYKLRHSLVP